MSELLPQKPTKTMLEILLVRVTAAITAATAAAAAAAAKPFHFQLRKLVLFGLNFDWAEFKL